MTSGNLKLTAQGDREITITRTFNAPRTLVFDAFTQPELLKRWMIGPPGWTMPVCEIDLRVGGGFRYVWEGSNGVQMGMSGVYREIVVPERLVATEKFDEPWYPGDAVGAVVLREQGSQTLLNQTIVYDSREARDMVLKSPMELGITAGYNRLDEILQSQN
jgi:uncharacterized protein YndB with AHSA1/START domain